MRKKSTLQEKGFHVLTVRLLPDEFANLKTAKRKLEKTLGLSKVSYTQTVVIALRGIA